MGEGIETWPNATGWPVREVVSCSIKREEQDGASQTAVPTGMGRAGSWLLHSTASVDIGDVGFGFGFPKVGLRANTYFLQP